MQPFVRITGRVAPLPAANIDTDVIMPKQFLKGIDRNGLREGTFFDLRFDKAGRPNPDFVLNRPGYDGTCFLAVGPNFGCGSSREHAVWGLAQLGIRALLGTTFAGIFQDNCARNGILTVALDADAMAELFAAAGDPAGNEITIDLPKQAVLLRGGVQIRFDIGALQKAALLSGTDAVGATLRHAAEIRRFEDGHFAANPWLA